MVYNRMLEDQNEQSFDRNEVSCIDVLSSCFFHM